MQPVLAVLQCVYGAQTLRYTQILRPLARSEHLGVDVDTLASNAGLPLVVVAPLLASLGERWCESSAEPAWNCQRIMDSIIGTSPRPGVEPSVADAQPCPFATRENTILPVIPM